MFGVLDSPRRAALWAALGLHLLAGLALWRQQPWADRHEAVRSPRPLGWVLWSPSAPDPGPAQPSAPGQAHGSARLPRVGSPAPSAAITLPSPPSPPSEPGVQAGHAEDTTAGAHHDAPGVASNAAAAATAAHPASAPPPPLNLTVPRGSWRDPARTAFASDGVRTPALEAGIAAALGAVDGIVEERLDADRLRVRRGSQCVELRRTRAGALDPGGPFRELWQGRPC